VRVRFSRIPPRQGPCKSRGPAFRRKFVFCICAEYGLPPEGRTTNIAFFTQARQRGTLDLAYTLSYYLLAFVFGVG
jgi:hypothetical protein